MDNYVLSHPRYEEMQYAYCGRSGLMLSRIALGFWHNFGWSKGAESQLPADYEKCRGIVEYAFDHGITYYDLANNYGPPAGEAERCFGKILRDSLSSHRDEMVIATKAGHDMWPGPYGEWGSRKSLMASIDQARESGVGYVAFSPLAQGLLTDRYLQGIPEGSRMTHSQFLRPEVLTPEYREMITSLDRQAKEEGRTIAQLALRWVLKRPGVTSVIVGASSVEQLSQNMAAL